MSSDTYGRSDAPEHAAPAPEPEVRKGSRRAWVLGGVATALALVAMFQVPPGVSALRAESDYNALTELINSSLSDTYEQLESQPGFSDFLKDDVWASPEWKAIAEAQERDHHEQLVEPILEQIRLDTEAASWPWNARVQGAADRWIESSTRPIETSPPLTEQSFMQGSTLLTYLWIDGKLACESGDLDSYLASDKERMAPAPRGSRLYGAWIENRDGLVRTAAGYQCPDRVSAGATNE